MQTMMATYMDQSRKMVDQMHDQLKTQTLNMFSAIPVRGFANGEQKKQKQ